MTEIVKKALAIWGFTDAAFELVAKRENQVYRVDSANGVWALRLHRQGQRSDAELRSELQWVAALDAGGLSVPSPKPTLDGHYLQVIDDIQVDVLTWLSGRPIGSTIDGLSVTDRVGSYRRIGRIMARLHQISDDWSRPTDFTRWSWDRSGLVGETPVWDRFWDNPALTVDQRFMLMALRDHARLTLQDLGSELDYGLIHADFVRENILIGDDGVKVIDFDDGGFGYRLFDIATALIKNLGEPDYDALKSALIEGYLEHRPIDLKALDLFLALRAATYVGWIITRKSEDGSAARQTRFIASATQLARNVLSDESLSNSNANGAI